MKSNLHKIFPISALCVLFSHSALAESVSLVIYDNNSKKPISDITVIVSDTGDFETSNGEGQVTFADLTLPTPFKAIGKGYQEWQGTVAESNAKLYLTAIKAASSTIEKFTIIVKQKGTGDPVEGAMVVLMASEEYEYSSDQGKSEFYDIEPPKKIKILSAGYETHIFDVETGKNNFVFYIEPIQIEGEGMEVVADRIVEKNSKIQLATKELIGSAGSSGDPLKAISSLPGVVSSGEDTAMVYMRGSGNDENITLVDGVPVGYLYHFGGMWSTVNAGLLQDINLFLGGFPVEYGDALGGVIDAKLRAPKKDRIRTKLDISTIASSFLIEGPVSENSNDSFYIGARRSYYDLIISPEAANKFITDGDEDDPDQVIQVPQFYDIQAKYRHQIQDGYLDAYYFAAQDQMKLELRDSAEGDPQLAGKLAIEQEYQSTGLIWNKQLSDKINFSGNFTYYTYDEALNIGQDENGQPFYLKVNEKSFMSRPNVKWFQDEKTTWTMGASLGYYTAPVEAYISRPQDENDLDLDFTSAEKYRLDVKMKFKEFSPFVKHRYQWNDKLVTTLGLRHTYFTSNGGFVAQEFSPRASVEYQLTERTLLTGSWGRYLQPPAGPEVVKDFGNPDLMLEEGEHRIVGIEHKFSPLYSVKAEAYHKPMKNLVVTIDENDPPDIYQNQGKGEAYGFDIFFKREAKNRKFGWLGLSYAKSRRTNLITDVTREFSGDQPLTLTAVWGQPMPGSWKKWDWSVKAEARSGKPYTQIIGRHQEDENDPDSRWLADYEKHNASRLPNYYKFDLRLSRNILFNESKIKFYIDIQNVTLRKNVVDYEYEADFSDFENPTEVTGLAFFPFIGVEAEF